MVLLKTLQPFRPARSAGRGLLSLGLLAALALSGCRTLEPIFEDLQPPLAWPRKPPHRIRWVGALNSSADLKKPRKTLQAVRDFLVGPRKPFPLFGPRAVVASSDGQRLWIADPGGRCLHRFNLEDRSYLRIRRVGETFLMSPVGVCPGTEGSIYVCDSEAGEIHRLSAENGNLIHTLKLPEGFQRPVAVSYRASSRELFVVDVSAHDIKVLTEEGRLKRVLGRRGNGPGEFNFPCDIKDDGQLLWIADCGNYRIQAIDGAGKPVVQFGRPGNAPGDFALPKGVALDSDGHIYVVDSRFENVQIFDRSGQLLLFFGSEGTAPGQFWLPSGIFINAADRIFICDSYNRRIQVLDYVKETENEAPH